jgi:putative transposase
MPKKRLSAEQIVVLLRQIEVLMSQGKTAPVACREAGISQQLLSVPATLARA